MTFIWVKFGVRTLISYGTFTWKNDQFNFTSHDHSIIRTFVDRAGTEGRLTRGYQKQRSWISFMTVSRLVREFLEHALSKGTRSWDIVVAKCLSVTLVSALGCRAGDVMRAEGYSNDETLHWCDIRLVLNDNVPEYLRISARITLKYTKGHKMKANDDLIRYLRPLRDKDTHVCPIAWLLAHALRHGLVVGKTITEVITEAFARPDRTIQWTQPTWPVLHAYPRHVPLVLSEHLRESARSGQLAPTIEEMGLIANVLGRVHPHALRLGAARDLAHLPKPKAGNSGHGYLTPKVQQYLDHVDPTTSQRYIGEITQEVYNDRADNKYTHPRELRFSDTSALAIVRARITPEEQTEWKSRNPRASHSQQAVRKGIQKARMIRFQAEAQPEPRQRIPLAPRSPGAVNEQPQSPSEGQPEPRQRIPLAPRSPSAVNEQPQSPSEDLNRLCAQVLSDDQSSEVEASQLAECDRLMFGSDDPTITATQFIDKYSAINIYSSQQFARDWAAYLYDNTKFDVTIGRVARRGFSLDEPTPWLHTCTQTPGCTFSTPLLQVLHTHQKWCTPVLLVKKEERVQKQQQTQQQQAQYACTKTPGCLYQTKYKQALERHMALCNALQVLTRAKPGLLTSMACPHADCKSDSQTRTRSAFERHMLHRHNWKTRYCEICEPGSGRKLGFYAYELHLKTSHGGQWPAPCPVQDCGCLEAFLGEGVFRRHLSQAHNITDEAIQQTYLPST